MELKDLVSKVKNKSSRRVGRGHGSGRGKTSGRGHKGAKARAGRLFYIGLEGDNVPYFRKIPKYGFNHKKNTDYEIVNVRSLESKFKAGGTISPKELKEKGLIKNEHSYIKLLGKGSLKKKFNVSIHKYSLKAKDKIEKSGGKIECLAR